MQGAHSLRGYVALSELLGSLEKEQLREYYNKANIALGSLYEKNSEVKNYVDQDSSLAVLKEVQYA
ncbi:MAG: hypothetical protein FJ264_17140 [Planctomycetes bacterium]|nr:hypothetical protein [Planctomycetota bacterium]